MQCLEAKTIHNHLNQQVRLNQFLAGLDESLERQEEFTQFRPFSNKKMLMQPLEGRSHASAS